MRTIGPTPKSITYRGFAHNEFGTEVLLDGEFPIISVEEDDRGREYLIVENEIGYTFQISKRQMQEAGA